MRDETELNFYFLKTQPNDFNFFLKLLLFGKTYVRKQKLWNGEKI